MQSFRAKCAISKLSFEKRAYYAICREGRNLQSEGRIMQSVGRIMQSEGRIMQSFRADSAICETFFLANIQIVKSAPQIAEPALDSGLVKGENGNWAICCEDRERQRVRAKLRVLSTT